MFDYQNGFCDTEIINDVTCQETGVNYITGNNNVLCGNVWCMGTCVW